MYGFPYLGSGLGHGHGEEDAIPRGPRNQESPALLIPSPSLPAATPPNAVDRPCLRLKVYVRPTSKCLGVNGVLNSQSPLSGQWNQEGGGDSVP